MGADLVLCKSRIPGINQSRVIPIMLIVHTHPGRHIAVELVEIRNSVDEIIEQQVCAYALRSSKG